MRKREATTELTEKQKNQYRFEGFRYSLVGPSRSGPDEIVPQVGGLYPFPSDPDNPEISDPNQNQTG